MSGGFAGVMYAVEIATRHRYYGVAWATLEALRALIGPNWHP